MWEREEKGKRGKEEKEVLEIGVWRRMEMEVVVVGILIQDEVARLWCLPA